LYNSDFENDDFPLNHSSFPKYNNTWEIPIPLLTSIGAYFENEDISFEEDFSIPYYYCESNKEFSSETIKAFSEVD